MLKSYVKLFIELQEFAGNDHGIFHLLIFSDGGTFTITVIAYAFSQVFQLVRI